MHKETHYLWPSGYIGSVSFPDLVYGNFFLTFHYLYVDFLLFVFNNWLEIIICLLIANMVQFATQF
jgi:hypothetical protein